MRDRVDSYRGLENLAVDLARVILETDHPLHGYFVAQQARLVCFTCPITILGMRRAVLSQQLRQVLDFLRHHPTADVVVNMSFSVGEGLAGRDIPKAEAVLDELAATGRAVVVAATANYATERFVYPARSARAITVGSLSHHGPFATKVDIVTRQYELEVDGNVHRGNSLAAPQVSALIARIVRDNRHLSVRGAAAIVLSTADPEWHPYSREFVKVVDEAGALRMASQFP